MKLSTPAKDKPVNPFGGHGHLNGESDAWACLTERGAVRVCRNPGCLVHVTPRRVCTSCHTPTEAL